MKSICRLQRANHLVPTPDPRLSAVRVETQGEAARLGRYMIRCPFRKVHGTAQPTVPAKESYRHYVREQARAYAKIRHELAQPDHDMAWQFV